MKTKAAVLFDAGKPFEIMELDLDGPGPGEVLIKYTAAGLCHSDLHLIDGDLVPRFPIVGGHEGAGIVEEVGPGVTKVQPGDHVVCSFIPELRHLPLLLDRQAEPVRHGRHDPRGPHARRHVPLPWRRPGLRRHVHARHVLRALHHLPALRASRSTTGSLSRTPCSSAAACRPAGAPLYNAGGVRAGRHRRRLRHRRHRDQRRAGRRACRRQVRRRRRPGDVQARNRARSSAPPTCSPPPRRPRDEGQRAHLGPGGRPGADHRRRRRRRTSSPRRST